MRAKEPPPVVLLILPQDVCLDLAAKLRAVTDHLSNLCRTVFEICSLTRAPSVEVQGCPEGSKTGTLQINLTDSTEDEVGAVRVAAEVIRELLIPILGDHVTVDDIEIQINPGYEAPEAPPGPCDMSTAIFAQGGP